MSVASSIAGGGSSGSAGGSGDVVGPSGATDNAVARFDSTTGKLIQSGLVIIGDSGEIGGSIRSRRANAGGVALVASDSSKTVSIISGGGDDDVQLPASPVLGTWYSFVVIGIDKITVQAAGSQVMYNGSVASSAGGTISSGVKGGYLYLEYVAANMWAGYSSGTWIST